MHEQGAHLLHAAAEQNHLLAARELASLMEVHVDADRAAEIYLKAIEMGDVRYGDCPHDAVGSV